MDKNEKICIGYIDSGITESQFTNSLANFLIGTKYNVTKCIRRSGPLVSLNRNMLVKDFLLTDNEWLFMLDSDIDMPLESYELLLSLADKNKYRSLVGLYILNMANSFELNLEPSIHYKENENYYSYQNFPQNSFFKVNNAGLGITLLHRSVLEEVQEYTKSKFAWFKDFEHENDWYGEDIYFFSILEKLGIDTYCHSSALSSHVKKINFTIDSYYRFMEKESNVFKTAPVDFYSLFFDK